VQNLNPDNQGNNFFPSAAPGQAQAHHLVVNVLFIARPDQDG
jgi:hypothetical protein